MTDQSGSKPRHVSLVAIPDAVASTLFGIFDVMNALALRHMPGALGHARAPFHAQIVGEAVGPLELASGVPIQVQRSIDTIGESDIVIVPRLTGGRRVGTHAWSSGFVSCTSAAP
jgi:hypothetical protein